ncbi:GIY-YIG nuclease family protein [Streptomyces sp. NPDC049602]|uniref:GIY-YIG nuclease family protein n=1 Tax=Streptomyces sp. NPDC049602 TaxID=3155504 RepID=UPI003412A4E4
MTDLEPTEFVYVMGSPGIRTVKIGRSVDPKRRLAQIQLMSPVPLELLAVHVGDHAVETYLHRRFASLRTHGEWFAFEVDPLIAVAEGVRAHAEEKTALEGVPNVAELRLDFLQRVDQASAELLQTRRDLERVIREARDAGVPLTAIAEHTGFSREWIRKIASGKSFKASA